MKFKSKKLTALAMAVLMAASTMSSAVFAEDVGVPAAVEDTEIVVSDEVTAPAAEETVPVVVSEPVSEVDIAIPVPVDTNPSPTTPPASNYKVKEGSVQFKYDAQNPAECKVTWIEQEVDADGNPVTDTQTGKIHEVDREGKAAMTEQQSPTCTVPGYRKYSIVIDDADSPYTTYFEIAALGHSIKERRRETITYPTCDAPGEAHVFYWCEHEGCEYHVDKGLTDAEAQKLDPSVPLIVELEALVHDFKTVDPRDGFYPGWSKATDETGGRTVSAADANVETDADGKVVFEEVDGKKVPKLKDKNKDGYYEQRKYCANKDKNDVPPVSCDEYEVVKSSQNERYATEGYIGVITKVNSVATDCNIQAAANVGTEETYNDVIVVGKQFKWNIKWSGESKEIELPDEYAKKIELVDCDKPGYFEVTYFNAQGWREGDPVPTPATSTTYPIITVKYNIAKHHMEEAPFVEFLSDIDEEQCIVKYNSDGTIKSVTNKSCKSDVYYYEVTHCTATGCLGKDCENDPRKNSLDKVLTHSLQGKDLNGNDLHDEKWCRSVDDNAGLHHIASISGPKTAVKSEDHQWNREVEWVVSLINAGKSMRGIYDEYRKQTNYIWPTSIAVPAEETSGVAAINELDDIKKEQDAIRAERAKFNEKIELLKAIIAKPVNKIYNPATKKDVDCAKLITDTATCTADGEIEVQYTCKVCVKENVHQDIIKTPKKGHLVGTDKIEQAKNPSCTEEGYVDTYIACSDCGEKLYVRERVVVPRLKHSNEYVVSQNVYADDKDNNKDGDPDQLILSWVGDKVIDEDNTDSPDNLWNYFVNHNKESFVLYDSSSSLNPGEVGTGIVLSNSPYVGAEVTGFRVKVQAVTNCKVCEQHIVTLNDSAYENQIVIKVSNVEKEGAQCKPGKITLSAVYRGAWDSVSKKYTDAAVLAEKTFAYYSSKEAYNGRNDHDWYIKSTYIDKPATETEEGLEVTIRECRVCGEQDRVERVLPKLEPQKPVERLPQVTGLTATLVKPGRVELKWNKVEGAVAYIILGSNAYRTGSQIAYVAGRESWTDTSADTDGTNAYWVLAVSKDDEGNIVRGQLDSNAYVWTWGRTVGAMGQVTATAVANGINVTWNAVSDANAYVVKAYVKGTKLRDCGSTTATSFVDKAAQVDVVTVYFVYPVYKSGSKTVAIGTPNAFTTSCGAKRKAA